MSWIDIIILIFAIASFAKGYVLGLSGALLGAIATLIGWATALLFTAPIKNLLQSLFGWVSKLAGYISPAIPGTPIQGGANPGTVLAGSGLPDWSKGVLERIVDPSYVVNSTSDLIAYWIANVIIVIIVFIVLLVVFGFIARYLMKQVHLAMPDEGFFHDFDKLIGGAVYFFMALFVLMGLLVLFSTLFPAEVAAGSPVGDYVMSSFFGGLVYSNFMGVQTIYGSLLRLIVGY